MRTNHAHSQRHRMRLGTHSCAECRRRKVRCIYAPHSNICRQCEAHCTPCHKQGARNVPASTDNGTAVEFLGERIQQLERVVGQMCMSQHIAADRSVSAGVQGFNPEQALQYLCPGYDKSPGPRRTDKNDDSDEQASQLEGPLLDLMQRALSIEHSVQPLPLSLPLSTPRGNRTIQALRALKLRGDDLRLVLRMTEKYWALWPVLPPGFIQVLPPPQRLDVDSAIDFINKSFESGISEVVAKGVLWLALCIQQLPSDFDPHHHDLPCSRAALLEAYLKGAEQLLEGPYNTQKDVTFLECLLLQAKIHINLGKPRKSWLTVRHAINTALLQGVQHTQGPASEKMELIWLELWSYDRQLSMFLGLPYSVPNSHPTLSTTLDDKLFQYMRSIGVISGLIGERNLNMTTTDSVSPELERELARMRDLIPADWTLSNGVELSLAQVFTKQIGKFYYNLLLKNAHIPYMLRGSSKNMGNSSSHAIALSASREMIEHYHGLRHSPQCELLICDLMDFQVFTAAMVLAINLLSRPVERDAQQDIADWSVIYGLAQTLERLARAMTCSVARQAADVLNYLYAAGHGIYSRRESFEVVIPYFGKVRISPVHRNGECTSDELSPSNVTEFAQSFLPQGPDTLGYHFGDNELGADWTLAGDFDSDWDWTGVFNIPPEHV
ncbi:hypothetical protein BJX99DRAFT_263642 [Aspergillus californicus]